MEASDDTRESPVHAVIDDGNTTLSPNTDTDRNGEGSLSSLNGSHVVHQRRRVNPESLAQRLGPDLVRDLDALITPGNTEMPSFAVRKELQERYCIDRRHVYDYFHSRGLRVVKEDKHGNPVTAKELPTGPLPNLRSVRHVPIQSARPHPYPVASQRKLLRPRAITKAKPGRPKKHPGSAKVNVPGSCETNGSTDANVPVPSPVAVRPTYVAVNPLLSHDPPPTSERDENVTFNSVTNPLDESFSVQRAIGDVAYAYRHRSVFERVQELAEYPTKGDESPPWNEASPPCAASAEGLLLPHAKLLTRDERHSMYEALSDSIGPAQGIQECQGTYRKHMEARAKLYFEGLLAVPYHHAQPSARTTTSVDRKAPPGSNEFRHWLSETKFLKGDAKGSPLLHGDYRNAMVAKHQDVDGVTDKFNQRSIPHWLPTLVELFPTPGGNLHNDDPLADSPIVHTRQITRTTALGNGCCAGDQQLFTAYMSTSSLPIHPSVAETRQSGQAQVHGSSGMSGPHEVTTSVAGTGSHPPWSGHDPYVSYPGYHLALSDKSRQARKTSTNSWIRLPPNSPRARDLDKTRTKPATSRDARRRTTSAAGDI